MVKVSAAVAKLTIADEAVAILNAAPWLVDRAAAAESWLGAAATTSGETAVAVSLLTVVLAG
jgi:hypothetical protein